MTLFLVKSLVDSHGEFVREDQLEKNYQWFKKGYMSSIGRGGPAAEELEDGQLVIDKALKHTTQCGNGSLVRVAPIGLVFEEDVAKAMEHAAASSQVTHATPRMLRLARSTQLIISTFQNMAKPDLASIVTNWDFEDPDPKNRFAHYRTFEALQEVPEERVSSLCYVVHRLEASLRAFFTTPSLEQGALKVVNLKDDADTVDATYGGLTEAFYDVEAVPQEWLDGLQERNVLNNVVENVVALVQRA
ncbi:MAG: hypothetical protein Q9198_008959 [Flavoplaca austrocitrina]